MLRTLNIASHNAYGNNKHESCPAVPCRLFVRYRLLMARKLLIAHCTMLTASCPPRAAGVIFCSRGAVGLPARCSFAVVRARGLAAASPIEISGEIQNGLG